LGPTPGSAADKSLGGAACWSLRPDWYVPIYPCVTPASRAIGCLSRDMLHPCHDCIYDRLLTQAGFERLERHTEELDGHRPDHKVPEDELLVQLDELPLPKFRTESNASSVFTSDVSSSAYTGSTGSNSGCASPISSFSQPTTGMSVSPFTLGPPEMTEKRTLTRNRSFSTPLDPQDAYYATELSYLRTEALPRLRHSALKVDTEWYEAKRTGLITDDDVSAFEAWWVEKKCNILSLNEKGKRLAVAIGLSPTGMGWTAP
jgi:hypothetical protein